ncbi:hypothetical protein C8F04DRAFT_924426, partial [Mycena alexandri]
TCPSDATAWVKHAFAQVSRESLGAQFDEVLEAWIELEHNYGFVVGTSASSFSRVKRPQEVTEWIRDGRGRQVEIWPIANMAKFQQAWWAWWRALQPSWHVPLPEQEEPPAGVTGEKEWGKLRVPGQNGLLSVVAALYWWGVAESARSREWE